MMSIEKAGGIAHACPEAMMIRGLLLTHHCDQDSYWNACNLWEQRYGDGLTKKPWYKLTPTEADNFLKIYFGLYDDKLKAEGVKIARQVVAEEFGQAL
jgi:hypothetical protein